MYLKSYFPFHFFLIFLKSDFNLLFLIEHHLAGGDRRRYYQKIKQNFYWQDSCEKKCYLLFLLFQISLKILFKKKKIIFETLFSPSFELLHSSPIVFTDHTELIFQDLLLYCTQKVKENQNQSVHFRHRGETHFLVLAQTSI